MLMLEISERDPPLDFSCLTLSHVVASSDKVMLLNSWHDYYQMERMEVYFVGTSWAGALAQEHDYDTMLRSMMMRTTVLLAFVDCTQASM